MWFTIKPADDHTGFRNMKTEAVRRAATKSNLQQGVTCRIELAPGVNFTKKRPSLSGVFQDKTAEDLHYLTFNVLMFIHNFCLRRVLQREIRQFDQCEPTRKLWR
jgi:hypothetical protein